MSPKTGFQGSKENMIFLTTQHANRSISLLIYFYLQVHLFNKKEQHMIVQRNSVLECAHQRKHAFFLVEFSYY